MPRHWKIAAAAVGLVIIGTAMGVLGVHAQTGAAKPDPSKSSYISVDEEEFSTVFARMSAAKAQVMKRQIMSMQNRDKRLARALGPGRI